MLGRACMAILLMLGCRCDEPKMTLPGTETYPEDLTRRLHAALAAKGPGYVPRTHHLVDGRPKYTNRLVLETSPYLLQHAHNPVDWFPWGDEAFERARKLGRPVLLSIGYSTCHWCHVMERESFEDEEIAAFINAHYVAIKVDREERPDVDSVYMTAVQLYTGRGGWPMTVVLTPDKKPFFGGTYFPPRDGARGARVGFLSILRLLREKFDKEPRQVLEAAESLSQAIAKQSTPEPASGVPGPEVLGRAAQALAQRYDARHGGFGDAPKFPRPCTYQLLLRYWRRTKDAGALEMVTRSLDAMANGGIYDHLAGGFHRYATDDIWLVPHFEKMLYDNAQLVEVYVETYQATGEPRFAAVARDVLDYVLREMTSPDGAFYSATDADSEGHEGTFFVWTPSELEGILGPEGARIASAYYGVTMGGNFEGKNILHRQTALDSVANDVGLSPADLTAKMAAIRAKLYAARKDREPPLLDDKIITEWNGQMLGAFAKAGFALDEPRYVAAAEKAADFILAKLERDGRLLRTHRAGEAKHGAVLEDYAFLIAGLLDLHEASFEARWLDHAIRLQTTLEARFLDPAGGFFTTPSDGEALLAREKPSYDGAQPSGNSVAAANLLRLAEYTGDRGYRERAERLFRALGPTLEGGALGAPKLAAALEMLHDKPKQIVVVGEDPAPLLAVLRRSFLPNRILVVLPESEVESRAARIPLLEGKRAIGAATAYVCTLGVCLKPATDADELARQVAVLEPLGTGALHSR